MFLHRFPISLDSEEKQKGSIPQTVIHLGWAMMFSSMSYVMIFSLFAIYLKSMGTSQAKIGLLEGSIEGLSFLMKLLSGIFSDIFRKRKTLIVLGFTLTALSKLVIAFSSTFLGGALGRGMERLGNGIQATPRDALVGDIAPYRKRGQCFGLKRSMGTMGSIFGGVIAYIAMRYFEFDFRAIFFLAIIPSMIAFFIVCVKVKEHKPESKTTKEPSNTFRFGQIKDLGLNFCLLMVINAVFMLGRVSETFMNLHAYVNFELSKEYAPIIFIIFNIGYTLSSYPIGVIADKTNRYVFLAFGILSLIMADLIFFNATSMNEFWIGVILWGVQIGVTMNIFTSLIVDTTPKHLHGTAFGCYYFLSAICVFIADNYAGLVSDRWSSHYAYLLSACIASLSLIILMLVMKYRNLAQKD